MRATGKLIDEVVDIIVREATPEQIILFGSHAKGYATSESDIDLLVVESCEFGTGKSRREELARLSKAVAGFQFPIDILLYSTQEVERRKYRATMSWPTLSVMVRRCMSDIEHARI